MFIIKNKGNDTIKAYKIKMSNEKVSLIKTQKDTPISDEIKIDVDVAELGDIYSADIELIITYNNNKSHVVKAVNFDPVTFNMEVVSFGSNKQLMVNSSSLSGVARKDVISENFKIIQTLVNDYFNSHSIPTIEEVRSLIPTDYLTEQDLENITLQGRDGKDGKNGADGFSPVVNVSKSGRVTTISVTNKSGTTTKTITDGKDGINGTNGKSAYEIAVENGYEGTEAEFGEGLANVTALGNETPSNIDFGSEVVIDAN